MLVPAAAVVVLMALVAVSVNVTGYGLGRREQEGPGTTVALSEAGRELLAVLEKARTVTFHGRYTAMAAEFPDATIRVEAWRRPPRARQDTEIVQDGQVRRTRSLVLDGEAVQCVQAGDTAWACRKLPPGQEAGYDPILAEVAEQIPTSRVSARDSVIRGEPARCFTLAGRERSTQFCVNRERIPVRVGSHGVASRGVTLELTELGRDVPDQVFDPPAPPS
ncbi:MAG: hypothetical protein KY439_08040 [Actinobacteria bacterium]|nr:hypothetical protein [Actinomycetota bacterium]